jgi:ribonucleoside-diphosphate reductase alpha chain
MITKELPRSRNSRTFTCAIGDCKLYLIAGEYPDGSLGEISVRVAKQGSTLAGLMDAFAAMVSLGLQHGVPFEDIHERFAGVRFEPSGWCDDPDLGNVESIIDYIFRKLQLEYGTEAEAAA